MSNHTPGPWKASCAPFDMAVTAIVDGGRVDIMAARNLHIGCEKEHEANITLASAAPELLEALQECVIELDCLMKTRPAYQGGMNMVERAKSAIAKATGKESA